MIYDMWFSRRVDVISVFIILNDCDEWSAWLQTQTSLLGEPNINTCKQSGFTFNLISLSLYLSICLELVSCLRLLLANCSSPTKAANGIRWIDDFIERVWSYIRSHRQTVESNPSQWASNWALHLYTRFKGCRASNIYCGWRYITDWCA